MQFRLPPDLNRGSVSQAGDLWRLGEHRLLCGDATDPANVDKLIAGSKPRWMWTDPPYGVDYRGGTAEHLTLANDRADGLSNLLEASFRAADAALGPGAALYVAHPAGPHSQLFARAFLDAGWHASGRLQPCRGLLYRSQPRYRRRKPRQSI